MSPTITHEVRDATPDDNDALVALSTATSVDGDVSLAVDRGPDFFALSRLKGDRWRVGVVDGPDGRPAGCVAIAERTVHLHGEPTKTLAVSDLRVHPARRREGRGDALIRWARDACVEMGGQDAFAFVALLAGGKEMEGRMGGKRGLPSVHRFATVRCWSVPLLWNRKPPDAANSAVTRATADDVDEMAALWADVGPQRQFAPTMDAAALAAWVDAAPGLELSSYWLARRPDKKLAGFVGIWDQEVFKRLQLTRYSPRARVFREAFNLAAPLVGGARLPRPGQSVRHLIAVHPCVPPSAAGVFRSLLVAAYGEHRKKGYSFITVGLDVKDPLAADMKGLLGQRTDVWCCVATQGDRWTGPPLDDRPAYHEIALV